MKRRSAAILASLLLASLPALAQQPASDKPLRWLVPYVAGGGSDFFARKVGQAMQESMGRTIVVENKPGANGAIAVADLLRLPADGQTVINVDNGIMVFNPALYRSLRYSPQNDMTPVALLGRSRMLLVVPVASGITDVRELIAKVKAQPGKLSYASAGAGSPQHLAMEMFKKVVGLDITHVPYRGGAAGVADLAGGQVFAMMADYAAARPFIEGGRIRPLAVAHSARVPHLPDVPTLPELGINGADAAGWLGVAVRSGTPSEQVRSLHTAVTAALAQPVIQKQLHDMGFETDKLTPEQFQEMIVRERERWHRLISDLNIALD